MAADQHDAQIAPVQDGQPTENATPPKRFVKTKKVFSVVLATKAWGRSFAILKHRASFPLLRQVLRGEKRTYASTSDLDHLPTEVLAKSCAAHKYILWVMLPVALWASVMLIRGLAALIRFDQVTPFLFYPPALLFFALARSFLSYKSLQAQSHALDKRAKNHANA